MKNIKQLHDYMGKVGNFYGFIFQSFFHLDEVFKPDIFTKKVLIDQIKNNNNTFEKFLYEVERFFKW